MRTQEEGIRMKKLLSLVLALVMLASMAVYLPLGVSATEDAAAEVIYAENFDGKDGTYRAEELCELFGWELLRGDPNAEIATITDGALTLKATDKDLVYRIKSAFAMVEGCTVEFDLTQVSYTGGVTMFSAIYVGTYDVATGVTRAVIPKCNNEGYHHMALANGVIDEQTHATAGWAIAGTGFEQTRGENILWGDGYSKPTSTTTWKNVYDVKNNQVDTYASHVRVNSTAANKAFESYDIADFMGKNAYLRVQAGRVSTFDNILITKGGDAIVHDSNVVFEQNFDDITYDPETETLSDLAQKTGFQSFPISSTMGQDPTEKIPEGSDLGDAGDPYPVGIQYGIVDGTLDILNPYCAASTNPVEPRIYIPEMEKAETVVIEFDQQYVYKDILGEYDRGDQSVEFQMYGRRSDVRMWFRYTQKGFATMKNYYVTNANAAGSATVGQIRPQTINYNNIVSGHKYTDWTDSHYNLYQSVDHTKIVMSIENGVEWYINGALTMFFNETQLKDWLEYGNQIMGTVLKYYIPMGCHVQYDNIKVTVDPGTEPDLLITEAASSAFGNDAFEYVEVYNNSTEPVNVYDYVLINQTIADSMKSNDKINLANVMTMYPGSYTYRSIATNGKDGDPLYSVTLTNPAYADGWLQPGEVAMIWSTADAMHSGTSARPTANEKEWKYTVDDFRKGTAVPANVKVFMAYNDYNRSIDNEGRYLLALAERSIYQPDYQPAYDRGDKTFAEVLNSYDNFTCYVYMLLAGAFDPADNRSDYGDNMTNNDDGVAAYPSNSGYCYRTFYSDSLNVNTGAPETLLAAQFDYGENNYSREGMCIDYANMETRFDVSPGVVYDRQKRVVEYTVDGYEGTRYLGTTVHYAVCDTNDENTRDGKSTLFSFINGTISFDDSMSLRLVDDTVIERVGANIFTLSGAALKFSGSETMIRWTTVIGKNDITDLVKYMDCNVIDTIEIGTLIAKTADLAEVSLTVENATADGKVTKVGAKTEKWFANAGSYNDYFVITADHTVDPDEMDTEYSAVGYISVTMMDGRTRTIYGGYNEDAHARSAIGLATTIREDGYAGYTAVQAWIDALLDAEN